MAEPSGRRSLWAWGLESEEPTQADRERLARQLSERAGTAIVAEPLPDLRALSLRPARVAVPARLQDWCTSDAWERAFHSHGAHLTDRIRAFHLQFPNVTDVVAHPRDEAELEATLQWCADAGHVVVPFGGGSSVVWGVNPPEADAVVTIAMDRFDRVLEVDSTSRAALVQAGVLGPHLEDQLRPSGHTLRHFPQSFRFSSLGGWIATRSGGHYATNHTHIDDFVESVRMLTPRGWWESRRLPGSGAGPSPDRLVIGSEGVLGIITQAWMRIQRRPRFRASAGVRFPSWAAGADAARQIAQAKLWPANLRLLDPAEAGRAAGLDGEQALLIIGFESAELPQAAAIAAAVSIARECGGQVGEEEVRVSDAEAERTGRGGAVGAWRDAFVGLRLGAETSLGLVADTFETAVTWDRWPQFDAAVRERLATVLREVFGHEPLLSCRFTHVYPDGPAPYYTWSGVGRQGAEIEMWERVKHEASEAVLAGGGTITHHHAVGRMHRPQYDRQRPELFAAALRAVKATLDPGGILNPGVLVDPQP